MTKVGVLGTIKKMKHDSSYYINKIKNVVESYTKEFVSHNLPSGFALKLLIKDQVAFDSYSGMNINSFTIFPLASLSKPFLATLIVKLAENKKLSLNQDIKEFFPLMQTEKKVTILDLLNQTSGIGEYLYSANHNDLNSWYLTEYCNYIQALPVTDIGIYKYSNSNYVLLASILESVTKSSYYTQLFDELFLPLNMQHTFSFEQIDQKSEDIAMPYICKDDALVQTQLDRLCMGYGDSSLLSSVNDISIWLNSKLFKEYIYKIELNPLSKLSPYNLGLFTNSVDDTLIFSHTGSMPGAHSLFVSIPKIDFSFIYLSNYIPENHEPLLSRLMDALGLS